MHGLSAIIYEFEAIPFYEIVITATNSRAAEAEPAIVPALRATGGPKDDSIRV